MSEHGYKETQAHKDAISFGRKKQKLENPSRKRRTKAQIIEEAKKQIEVKAERSPTGRADIKLRKF